MDEQDPQPQALTNSQFDGPVITVDVFAKPKGGGGIKFSHKWRFKGGNEGPTDEIDVPAKKKGEPGPRMAFELHDQTQRGLSWDDDPIWVSRTKCPTAASEDPEIPRNRVKCYGDLLEVYNANEQRCDLYYSLNFTDRHGNPEPYDPMIRNGGISQ